MDNFFFIGLPYAALAIMIIGSIYRYRASGFTFSSLSTQFLESNTLHNGARPFHWGIMFLFFGHLTAFLFPSTVIVWANHTLRLLIIEISAFAFGVLALYGLIVLIYRRMTSTRIRIVTSKMDVLVFILLLVQIASGLWVAYFHRWGSSWFASVLTPYLNSIFKLTPDINAISVAPLAVKIHLISAFSIIGMIPFTRFAHFLVYPFQYITRPYQVVIWNWNRKRKNSSRQINDGMKSLNN